MILRFCLTINLLMAAVPVLSSHPSSKIPVLLRGKTPRSHTKNDSHAKAAHPQNTIIAFSAEHSEVKSYLPGNTVIFDRTITNEGGFYINNTGQFLCTNDDVYVFTWDMAKYGGAPEPGTRLITKLQIGLEEIKFGPKVSFAHDDWDGGTNEMVALAQCRNPSAITVGVEPWSETESSVQVKNAQPSLSGFRLWSPDFIVGFMAELSVNVNKFPGDIIAFDRVLQNYGNHYYPITGAFVCPDNGTYVFMVSTHNSNADVPWSVSRLKMDEEEVLLGPITFRATEEHDSGSASITAVTRCQHSKLVYVESQQTHDFPYTSYGARLTSFMGFRVDQSGENLVAFMAALSANFTTDDSASQIPLTKVLTNIGDAYDGVLGHFICPDAALYMFSVTTVVRTSFTNNGIYLDGKLVRYHRSQGQTDQHDSDTSGSCTSSVIARCIAGKAVQLMHFNPSGRTYLADFTSFSGYRLPGQDI